MSKFLSLFLSVTLISGCSNASINDFFEILNTGDVDNGAVAKPSTYEFYEYLDAFLGTKISEDDVLNPINGVQGDNFVSDQILLETIEEILPTAEAFLEEIELIESSNQKLNGVHQIYVEAWKLYMNSWSLQIDAIKRQDIALAQSAQDLQVDGGRLMNKYLSKLEKLRP